jgi:hypothetical protein
MLIAASLVVLLLGLLHSALGEWLIFRHLRHVGGFRSLAFPPIVGAPEPPRATLRATWHNLSILGVAFAVVLGRFGMLSTLTSSDQFVVRALALALFTSAVLRFASTRGKHIGWLGFLAAAMLSWFGARDS